MKPWNRYRKVNEKMYRGFIYVKFVKDVFTDEE